jgi:hypothetical protein
MQAAEMACREFKWNEDGITPNSFIGIEGVM